METERFIRNCDSRFVFRCPLRWSILTETQSPAVRACNTCHQSVYACETPDDAEEYSESGRRFAVAESAQAPRARVVPSEQLRKAQDAKKRDGGRIGYHPIKTGAIEESKLTEFLSRQYGVPATNLRDFKIDPEVIKLVPKRVPLKHQIIPVNRAGATLIIAMSDPSNIFAIDDVKFLTGCEIEVVVAPEVAIGDAIEHYYGPSEPER